MNTRWIALALLIAASASGCKKKQRYSPTCKSAASLTSPWQEMELPVKAGRVCSSDGKRVEVQFLSGTRDELVKGFADRLVALGYAQTGDCGEKRCVYQKEKQRINLMGMSAERWRTVVLWTN